MGPLYVLVGPTASGKSALGIELARQVNGTIINMDAMQLYRALPILTAQPDAADLAAVPHALYGVLDAADKADAARWADMARQQIAEVRGQGRLPILLGGTGLYLKVLLGGIADIPAIPDAIVQEGLATLAQIGSAALHERLATVDAVSAARLKPGDSQRVLRAWNVHRATGRALSAWQADGEQNESAEKDVRVLTLLPDRAALYDKIDRRFAGMVDGGALDEVRALAADAAARQLRPELPLLKAIGYPELLSYIAGESTLPDALSRASQLTRNYAKRQVTWFTNQVLGKMENAIRINGFGTSDAARAGLNNLVNKS